MYRDNIGNRSLTQAIRNRNMIGKLEDRIKKRRGTVRKILNNMADDAINKIYINFFI